MKFLKYLLAFLFGAFGGFLIYMELALVFFSDPNPWFVALAFFGGWGWTSYWVVRRTTLISEVLARSFILSAVLSFALAPAIFIFTMKIVDTSGSDAAVAGSFIGGGIVTSFGVAMSIALTLFSLLGYAVLKLFTRESSSSAKDMMECDFCSEIIRVSAKKCRHCGEFLGSGS